MTETTTVVAPILDETDIATLNAARDVLDGVKKRTPYTFNGGVVYEAADRASDAVFQVLNTAHSYGGLEMTDAQLHSREES